MKKLLIILLCLPMIGFGQTAEDFFNKGRKDFLNEDYLSAIYNFMDCLEKDPYYVDAYFHRAMSIILLENTTETQLNLALVDMNVYLEARPKYADGYFGRGKINKQLKNYENAIHDLTKSIELQPTNLSDVLSERGDSYFLVKNYKKAINDYTNAINNSSKIDLFVLRDYLLRAYSFKLSGNIEAYKNDINKIKESLSYLEKSDVQILNNNEKYLMDYEQNKINEKDLVKELVR